MKLGVINMKRLTNEARLPLRAHGDDMGLDVASAETKVLAPGAWGLVATGWQWGGVWHEVLEHTWDTDGSRCSIEHRIKTRDPAFVHPRSGLALKHGVTVLNSPGTIDGGYRGQLGIILINHSQQNFVVTPGMRIAQLVVHGYDDMQVKVVEDVDDSERDEGGFGSTGV